MFYLDVFLPSDPEAGDIVSLNNSHTIKKKKKKECIKKVAVERIFPQPGPS